MIQWPLMFKAWGISLSLTLMLELFYAVFWGFRKKEELCLIALANVLTNPIVVFVFYYVRFKRINVHYGWVTLFMEIFAFVTESLLYQRFSRKIIRPWLFSLSANAFSYAIGELLTEIR